MTLSLGYTKAPRWWRTLSPTLATMAVLAEPWDATTRAPIRVKYRAWPQVIWITVQAISKDATSWPTDMGVQLWSYLPDLCYFSADRVPPPWPPDISCYLSAGIPAATSSLSRTFPRRWPMYRNNKIGDCTVAAEAHAISLLTKVTSGRGIFVRRRRVIDAYAAISGYVRGKPETDTGADLLDALEYWRMTGIGKHKIDAYLNVDVAFNGAFIRSAIDLFGVVLLGLALPTGLQAYTTPGQTWTLPAGQAASGDWAPWSWGGHVVAAYDYNSSTGNIAVVSWKGTYYVTPTFLTLYCAEAYVPIANSLWPVTNPTFDLTAVQDRYTELTGAGGLNAFYPRA